MRVVALADSLAMPRNEDGDVLLWEQTWPWRLGAELRARNVDCEVINCGQRARTCDTLDTEFQELTWKRPDVVVIQIGVVDCAPRIISKSEKRTLRYVPAAIRDRVIADRKGKRAEITRADPLAKVYSRPQSFRSAYQRFATKIAQQDFEVRVFVLPIVIDGPTLDQKSPGYSENVRRYNQILVETCRSHDMTFVPLPDLQGAIDRSVRGNEGNGEYFASDHYHLSPKGSAYVGALLSEAVLPAP